MWNGIRGRSVGHHYALPPSFGETFADVLEVDMSKIAVDAAELQPRLGQNVTDSFEQLITVDDAVVEEVSLAQMAYTARAVIGAVFVDSHRNLGEVEKVMRIMGHLAANGDLL